MMRIIAYDGTQEDMDRIISEQEKEGYILIEIQNITEGNFLGFSQTAYTPPEVPTDIQVLDQKIKEHSKSIEDLNAAMTEIILGGGE